MLFFFLLLLLEVQSVSIGVAGVTRACLELQVFLAEALLGCRLLFDSVVRLCGGARRRHDGALDHLRLGVVLVGLELAVESLNLGVDVRLLSLDIGEIALPALVSEVADVADVFERFGQEL